MTRCGGRCWRGGRWEEQAEFRYDYLIVAAGVQQSYFGHDEFARYAPGMKTISDALLIRRRVFGAFEMAETAEDPDERRRWLTFALVGAGPTGVELAGQIRELATKTLREEYRRITPEDARVLLFDGGSAPLASFGPKLSAKAASSLVKLGVEQHMHSIVTDIDATGLSVRAEDGTETRYEAGTVLWTAGIAGPPVATAVAEATGAKQDRAGRIQVGPDLSIPGHPEITVIGDVMSLNNLPGVAEVAMQTGLYAGRHIRHKVGGRPRPSRSATTTWDRLPTSPAVAPWSPWGGCSLPVSPGGSSGCSSTSRSLPGTGTGSAPWSAGGSPSPVTCGANAPSPPGKWAGCRTCTQTQSRNDGRRRSAAPPSVAHQGLFRLYHQSWDARPRTLRFRGSAGQYAR